jgi:hypothetical protein
MKTLSRRTFLRGAVGGTTVALALPTLDAMLTTASAATAELGPIFGVFFWANGLPWHAGHGQDQRIAGHPDLWTPAEIGPYTPTELLQPVARHDVSVLTGLRPHTDIPSTPVGQSDGHMRGFMVALTGDRPRPEGFDHPSHTLTALRPTLDQLVAKDPSFYGEDLPAFRSLVLGVSTARFHDYGHWNNISYNGPDSINPAMLDPGQLHDRIFGVSEDADLRRRADLLDAVLEDAHDLRARLGAADRRRVDAHLEHLFEVQRRLDLGSGTCEAPERPFGTRDFYAQNQLMAELLATGLACNITRVFSYMLTSPASTHLFSAQGASSGMHATCHDGQWLAVRNITEFQMRMFGDFLDALDAQEDPAGGSVLDRTLVYGTSEYGEGWKHSVNELPVVLAGGANGRHVRGQHVRDADGNLSRAQLTALRMIGLDYDGFGFNGGETDAEFSELIA